MTRKTSNSSNKASNQTINLNTCVAGQKLLLRSGDDATYSRKLICKTSFPHRIQIGDRILDVTNDGCYWPDKTEDEDDVVEITPLTPTPKELKVEPYGKPARVNKESNLKILLKKRGSRYQFKVIDQPESFRNPKNNDQLCFQLGSGFKFFSCEYPAITENGISVYLRGDCHFKDNDPQLINLTEDQVNTIRESVKLFNEEYGPSLVSGRPVDTKSKAATLEEIHKEYEESLVRALDIYKAKINNLITGVEF